MVVRAYLDQKKTESSDLKKEKKKQYVDFEILVDHENLVTISCFCTFLIFIQSYIFNFCIYFKCFFLYLFLSIFFFYRNQLKKVCTTKKKLAINPLSKKIINNDAN